MTNRLFELKMTVYGPDDLETDEEITAACDQISDLGDTALGAFTNLVSERMGDGYRVERDD